MSDVTALGRGRYLVSDGTRRRIAYAAGPPEARWVFLDGRVYVIDAAGGRDGRRMRPRDDRLALAAPMPGTVVVINVEPGRQVSAGDVLIMLEAMKMEVPIKAPRDGVVKSLACREGELVQPGIPLLELD